MQQANQANQVSRGSLADTFQLQKTKHTRKTKTPFIILAFTKMANIRLNTQLTNR